MQVTGACSVAGDGAQATAVAVLSVTVSVAGGLALAASVALGPKDAVRCWAPDALGLYVSVQRDVFDPAALSVQVVAGVKAPAPSEEMATEPAGEDCVPLSVSVTVAVHVDGDETATEPGVQLSAVAVCRSTAVTAAEPLLAVSLALP